jgi:hypothetical protein
MLLSIFLSATLWLPALSLYTLITDHLDVFKHSHSFKPSELQASILKFDYGYSPEHHRPSRREKIALKLTQVTKMNTEAKD